MSSALIIGMRGQSSAATVASGGMAMSVIGSVSGAMLLFSSPLAFECALLTAYLAASAALYIYGFGIGSATKARLIRNSAPIQKS